MSYRQQLRHITCRWFAPCVFILTCVMQPVPAYAGERPPITLRAGPGEQHAVIATLPPARTMEFTVFEERGEWAKVRVDSGSEGTSPQEGWLRLDALLANASAGGLDLSPSSPGASPSMPTAERSPAPAPEPIAPQRAKATTGRPSAPVLPSPTTGLSVPPVAPRPPEPAPPSPVATRMQTTPGPSTELRTALVIGNASYEREMGSLKNSLNDAEDIASTLRQLGFQVTLVRDAVYEQMDEALQTFLEQLRQNKGVGLFYFAGHGAELDKKGYLLPLRSGLRERWQLPYKAMQVDYIQAALEEAGNRMNMIILDACRDIPTFEASANKGRGLKGQRGLHGLPPTTASPDMLIAYATNAGQVALDGDEKGRNGIFTKHLLQAMKTPGLSAEDVVRETVRGVLEETQGKQRPYSSISLTERFEFAPSSSTTALPRSRVERPDEVTTTSQVERSEGQATSGVGRMARAENPRERQENQPTSSPPGQALRLEQAKEKDERAILRDSIGMEFVCLPGGELPMGSNTGRADAPLSYFVRIAPFCLGKYEVTQEQWRAVMGYNPSPVADPKLPVHGVTWEEAQAFVKQLNVREPKPRYRLPQEHEWEYAARAGSSGPYGFRADEPLDRYAWYSDNAKGHLQLGGQLKPNAWGLHDMHGNIAEWVQDQPGPAKPPATRGGSWADTAEECRATAQKSAGYRTKDKTVGVRVVLDNP